jgi:hypothetical protein
LCTRDNNVRCHSNHLILRPGEATNLLFIATPYETFADVALDDNDDDTISAAATRSTSASGVEKAGTDERPARLSVLELYAGTPADTLVDIGACVVRACAERVRCSQCQWTVRALCRH